MEDKKTTKQPSLNTEEQQPLKLIKHPQKPNKQTFGPAKAINQNQNNTPMKNTNGASKTKLHKHKANHKQKRHKQSPGLGKPQK